MKLNKEDPLRVRQEYQKQLVLPPIDKVPAKQFFLCPVGLVGAEKTTVVKPLSETLSLVRISSDEIRKILKEQEVGYGQLMEIVQPLAEELALRGFSIAFDAFADYKRVVLI